MDALEEYVEQALIPSRIRPDDGLIFVSFKVIFLQQNFGTMCNMLPLPLLSLLATRPRFRPLLLTVVLLVRM